MEIDIIITTAVIATARYTYYGDIATKVWSASSRIHDDWRYAKTGATLVPVKR